MRYLPLGACSPSERAGLTTHQGEKSAWHTRILTQKAEQGAEGHRLLIWTEMMGRPTTEQEDRLPRRVT